METLQQYVINCTATYVQLPSKPRAEKAAGIPNLRSREDLAPPPAGGLWRPLGADQWAQLQPTNQPQDDVRDAV